MGSSSGLVGARLGSSAAASGPVVGGGGSRPGPRRLRVGVPVVGRPSASASASPAVVGRRRSPPSGRPRLVPAAALRLALVQLAEEVVEQVTHRGLLYAGPTLRSACAAARESGPVDRLDGPPERGQRDVRQLGSGSCRPRGPAPSARPAGRPAGRSTGRASSRAAPGRRRRELLAAAVLEDEARRGHRRGAARGGRAAGRAAARPPARSPGRARSPRRRRPTGRPATSPRSRSVGPCRREGGRSPRRPRARG